VVSLTGPLWTKRHSTPWSRVLLEKLTGHKLVKKFPASMELKGSLHYSQEPVTWWVRSIQSMLNYVTSWRSILILSSHLCLCLPSDLHSSFPTNIQYAPPFNMHYMPFHSNSSWSPKYYLVRNTTIKPSLWSILHSHIYLSQLEDTVAKCRHLNWASRGYRSSNAWCGKFKGLCCVYIYLSTYRVCFRPNKV
jgi:hypothetical protein